MQTFLIIGGSTIDRNTYITQQITSAQIHEADIIKPPEESLSLGILTVRELIARINLRPMVGPKKAVILNFDAISNEAQQALLKTLEEPPDDTIIYISAPNEEPILPTILSRCSIHVMAAHHEETHKDEYQELWETLLTTAPLERLTLLPDLGKERDAYRTFIAESLLVLRSQMLASKQTDHLVSLHTSIIKGGLQALNALEHNCNPRLTLDNWILFL